MHREYEPEQLLGRLNEVEKKYAPKTLYASGRVDFLQTGGRVSVVGSRKVSPDGRSRTRKLAEILVKHGVLVISGLAEGVDTAAHERAIELGGRTCGILGTPLDKSYPKSNRELQARMMSEHLVLSQFPSGHPTTRQTFPMRNRTMALVSDATVIIEGGERSGTKHQAWEAIRLGRPVFFPKSFLESSPPSWVASVFEHGGRALSDETIVELLGVLPIRDTSDQDF